jgi:hypothetical protein
MNRTKIAALTLGLFAITAFAQTPSTVTPEPVSSPEIKRQHQRLYANQHSGKDFVQETQAGKDVSLYITVTGVDMHDHEAEKNLPAYPSVELLHESCDADAVVSGAFTASETSLTEDRDFIFTDYCFHVALVIKPVPGLSANSDIVVTRPGGVTTLNGHKASVEMAGFPLFELNRRYLLFLRYVPTTNSYRAWQSGVFLLGSDQRSPVQRVDSSARPIQSPSTQHENEFVMEVRAAVTSACPGAAGPR